MMVAHSLSLPLVHCLQVGNASGGSASTFHLVDDHGSIRESIVLTKPMQCPTLAMSPLLGPDAAAMLQAADRLGVAT